MRVEDSEPLVARYRGIVSDLDGVVYRGPEAISSAVTALIAARSRMPVVYATNNASRTAATISAQLEATGLPVSPRDVVTSAVAGAALLAERLPPGSPVLAVGGEGVLEALRAHGLSPRRTAESDVVAVLQGYGARVTAGDLAEASLAVAAGAQWVATNLDRTLPIDRGTIPGNGTLVAAVAEASGRDPMVVGKPFPPLYELAARVLGTAPEHTLAIGDRLETDIAGAEAAEMDSVWVLTGVHGLSDLAESSATPTYALLDLSGLHLPYPAVRREGDRWHCGPVRVGCSSGGLDVHADSSASKEELRRWVLPAAARMVCDVRGSGASGSGLQRVAADVDVWVGRRA